MSTSWLETLKLYLPYIGGAVGGPVASLAIKAGIVALGGKEDDAKGDIKPLDILKDLVINASHDVIGNAQKSDLQFKEDMAKINIRLEEVHAKDRISARDLAKSAGAIWHHLVGISLVAANIGVLFWILNYGIPSDSSQVVLIIIGILQGWGGAYLLFLYGSSKGSKDKDNQIEKLMDKIK